MAKVKKTVVKKKSTVNKEDKIIYSKDEIESTNHNSQTQSHEEVPSWYHYAIVFAVIVGFFGLVYFGFNYYESKNVHQLDNLLKTYEYKYKVGNVTYNIAFHYPIEDIETFNYPIVPTKQDLINSINFTFVFKEYNGTDNGKVTVASTKFLRFLRYVYGYRFDEDNFKRFNETSCEDSKPKQKVVIFDPYKNVTIVNYNPENGCIEFDAKSPEDLVKLTDLFIYTLTK